GRNDYTEGQAGVVNSAAHCDRFAVCRRGRKTRAERFALWSSFVRLHRAERCGSVAGLTQKYLNQVKFRKIAAGVRVTMGSSSSVRTSSLSHDVHVSARRVGRTRGDGTRSRGRPPPPRFAPGGRGLETDVGVAYL